MGLAHGGNLGQVRNSHHLASGICHLLHEHGHLRGYGTADTGVNLVEDDCRQVDGTADHRLQREHHTCYLTSRGHLGDGHQLRALVGREEEDDPVGTVGGKVFGLDVDLEPHVDHPQRHEPRLHGHLHLGGSLPADTREDGGSTACGCGGLVDTMLVVSKLRVAIVDALELLTELIADGDESCHVVDMVLLLQRVYLVEHGVDIEEARWIELDIVRIVVDIGGDIGKFNPRRIETGSQILHFRVYALDAVQRIGGLADPPYDPCVVGVEDVVGVEKGRFDVLGVRQGSTLLLEFLLHTVGELGRLELIELETDELLVLARLLYPFLQVVESRHGLTVIGVSRRIIGLLLFVVGYNVDDAELEILLL